MSNNQGSTKNMWGAVSLIVLIILLAVGAGLMGLFNYGMAKTNTTEFCISCHEMEQVVYQEYKETIHYKNPSGVRVSCASCHVPDPWFDKVIRKIKASTEIYYKLTGKIDTPEKFEEHRWELANRVWRAMEENDSQECRNCHDYETMDLSEQDRSARKRHSRAIDKGETCIDCHKGIAHEEPTEPESSDA